MARERLMQMLQADKAGQMPARPAIPLWIWGALAAAVAFALYNAYEARTTNKTIRHSAAALQQQIELRRESARQLAEARREALILTDPESIKIAMRPANTDLPELHAAWHSEFGLLVMGEKLPIPPVSHTLQLWLIPKVPGAKAVPSLTRRPNADGKFELLIATPPDLPNGTKVLAITEEPEGGSAQPTSTPIWVGRVARK